MGNLAAILTLVGQLIPVLTDLATKAIAAHSTGDQATLDRLHDQAVAMADSLKPEGG